MNPVSGNEPSTNPYCEDWVRHRVTPRIVGVPINPHSLYVYWSVDEDRQRMIANHFMSDWCKLPLCLCVYDVTDLYFDGYNAEVVRREFVPCEADNWYFHHLGGDRNYIVDLAVTVADKLFSILRSNTIALPPNKSDPHMPSVQFIELAGSHPQAHTINEVGSSSLQPNIDRTSHKEITPFQRYEGQFDGYHLAEVSQRSENRCKKDI